MQVIWSQIGRSRFEGALEDIDRNGKLLALECKALQ